jgi:small subunit ribosomal protein S13
MLINNRNIKKTQNIRKGLKYTYGISNNTSNKIANYIGLGNKYKLKNVSNIKIQHKNKLITNYLMNNNIKINNDLKIIKYKQILKYIKIKHYKGNRYKLGYPVNGQRTRSNAKTIKKLHYQYKIKSNFIYELHNY